MNDLYSIDFTRSLPPALKNDPDMLALARAIGSQLQDVARQIKKSIIYARIDELDEQTLDILAYDLHVDWYDYSYPIDVKRRTIKDSVKVHRRLGTKYAVETALGAVFPGTRVEEWFEYDGDPYTFRLKIGAGDGVTAQQQAAVLERVRFYKNLRSHLEMISYQMEQRTTIHAVGFHAIGTRVEVWPYLADSLTMRVNVSAGAFSSYAARIEINPSLTSYITSGGSMLFGGYTQHTRKLKILPLRNEG